MKTDSIIYTKTARGIMALKNGDPDLTPPLQAALTRVDGRSTLVELGGGLAGNALARLADVLKQLEKLGFIRVFTSEPAPAAARTTASLDNRVDYSPEAPPAIEVTEHGPEEGVLVWAGAVRAARELQKQGYYTVSAPHGAPHPDGGSGLRVLVVEDVSSIARLLQLYLQKHDFGVDIVGDGRAAIDRLDSDAGYDLVLLDVNMPLVNGFDVLEYMRSKPALQDMPVIMVTARVSEADVLRGLRGGADGYVFKPFEWETLGNCIAKVLRLAV